MSVEKLLRDLVKDGRDAFVRLSEGRIDLRVGCQEKKPALIFITAFEPPPLPGFASLSFLKGRRGDGKWTTLLRLERDELDAIFVQLATDLANTALAFEDEHQAHGAFVERVKYWRELFASKRREMLADGPLRGFIGELLFLRRHAIPRKGAATAISSWAGPVRGTKDFRFAEVHVEVKAVAGDDAVAISSLGQLEAEGAYLSLAVVPVQLRSSAGPDSISVAHLVESLREQCNEGSRAILEQKLTVYGYTDLPEYANIHFDSEAFSFFAVRGEFPRLTRTSVPIGIVGCEYVLLQSALKPFVVDDWEATA